jgi:hypothetical protein
MRWTIILIVVAVIGIISAWSILNRQANQNKSYSGAKFVECSTEGSRIGTP